MPVDSSAVTNAIQQANNAFDYLDYTGALETLTKVAEQLGCLVEPLDAEAGGRLYYLQGIAAFGLEDKLSAWAAFRQALTIHPEQTWDNNFPPDARPLFDVARGELENSGAVSVEFIPTPGSDSSIWVDGRTINRGKAFFRPGLHLLQVSSPSMVPFTLRLEADLDTVLVIPSAAPSNALDWAANDEPRPSLNSILNACVAQGAVINVPVGNKVWRSEAGSDEWVEYSLADGAPPRLAQTELPIAPATTPSTPDSSIAPPAPLEPRLSPQQQETLQRVTVWGGGGLALFGGALSTMGYLQAQIAQSDITQSTTTAEINEGMERYDAGSRRFTTGIALAGVGLASSATGLLALDGRWSLRAHQGGLAIQTIK